MCTRGRSLCFEMKILHSAITDYVVIVFTLLETNHNKSVKFNHVRSDFQDMRLNGDSSVLIKEIFGCFNDVVIFGILTDMK